MLRHFDDGGIRFTHPSGWPVEVDSDGEGLTQISLAAADGVAFAVVRVDEARPDPGEVLGDAIEALRAEYPTLRVEAAAEEIGGRRAAGFDAEFFQFDVAIAVTLRCFRTERRTVFFMGQWSELEEGDPGGVIEVIRGSLEESDLG